MRIADFEMFNLRTFSTCFPNHKRIVLVGNGPTDIQDNEIVQGADVVVRFNDWGSRGKIVHNVSRRCDLVVTNMECHSSNIGKADVGVPRMAVSAIPYPHHMFDADKLLLKYYPESTLAQFNPYVIRELCIRLGYDTGGIKHPMPTVGLATMFSLAKIWTQANIYVCGFNWNYNSLTNTIQDQPLDDAKIKKQHFHYYIRELAFVARVFTRLPEWTFSESAKQAIHAVTDKTFTWETTWPIMT